MRSTGRMWEYNLIASIKSRRKGTINLQCGAPDFAKLVCNSNTWGFMADLCISNGASKPTHRTAGLHPWTGDSVVNGAATAVFGIWSNINWICTDSCVRCQDCVREPRTYNGQLVGGDWNHGILNDCPYILGMSSFQLTFSPSFFRGLGWSHQPDDRDVEVLVP